MPARPPARIHACLPGEAAVKSLPSLPTRAGPQEPAKKVLLAWQKAGCPSNALPPREAFCILQTPDAGEQMFPACLPNLTAPCLSLSAPAQRSAAVWRVEWLQPDQMLCLPPNAVEAIVLLSEQPVKLTSWVEVPEVQPLATPDDCFDAEAIVKADPEIQVGQLARAPCCMLLCAEVRRRPAAVEDQRTFVA